MIDKLREDLELMRSFVAMHEIETDAGKKTRIRDAARELVTVLLPHTEREVQAIVDNDIPPP